jgi:hypothetical protein
MLITRRTDDIEVKTVFRRLIECLVELENLILLQICGMESLHHSQHNVSRTP